MTTSQIKLGIAVIVAQCILLAMTLAFHANMDRQAEKAGIATIIEEAGR